MLVLTVRVKDAVTVNTAADGSYRQYTSISNCFGGGVFLTEGTAAVDVDVHLTSKPEFLVELSSSCDARISVAGTVAFTPDSYASDVMLNGELTRTTPWFEVTPVAVSPVDNHEDGGGFALGQIDQSIASTDSDYVRTQATSRFLDDF